MGNWTRVCADCRFKVSSASGFAYDNTDTHWQDEMAMVQDRLVAAHVMAENWKDRTSNKKGDRSPIIMSIQEFSKLSMEDQASVTDDAYSAMYLTGPKVIHRGAPIEIENIPEDEIPTPDQIRCTKVNSPCFQWMNMGMCQHGIYCHYLHDLCHNGHESDNKYNIFAKGTGSG